MKPITGLTACVPIGHAIPQGKRRVSYMSLFYSSTVLVVNGVNSTMETLRQEMRQRTRGPRVTILILFPAFVEKREELSDRTRLEKNYRDEGGSRIVQHIVKSSNVINTRGARYRNRLLSLAPSSQILQQQRFVFAIVRKWVTRVRYCSKNNSQQKEVSFVLFFRCCIALLSTKARISVTMEASTRPMSNGYRHT